MQKLFLDKEEVQAISISQLADRIKQSLESNFSDISIKGEIGKVVTPPSGHVYLDLKDEKALINSIIWKGVYSKINFKPEMGMEVIVTGKVTNYAPRSNYQFVITSMRQSGMGSLMALFEERRKKLSAEGLFDPAHKKQLPTMPRHIGIITSLKGAVLHDMLHRMRDRFPVHFTIWPSLVQGKEAASQIIEAVNSFDKLPVKNDQETKDGKPTRPELIIIARGGGSIEDLWPFNEEELIRTIFKCDLPVISAVGHESDWTLCDMVADLRAPTPTAAIELVLPRIDQLKMMHQEKGKQLTQSLQRIINQEKQRLKYIGSLWYKSIDKIATYRQRLDLAWQQIYLRRNVIDGKANQLLRTRNSLKNLIPTQKIILARTILINHKEQLIRSYNNYKADLGNKIKYSGNILESLSYHKTIERGFAILKDSKGQVISTVKKLVKKQPISVILKDGKVSTAIIAINNNTDKVGTNKVNKKKNKLQQDDLFS